MRGKCCVINERIQQDDFGHLASRHRYFSIMPPMEGYGSVPLERMVSGCTVMGSDGMGGTQHMDDRVNYSLA